MTGRHHQQGRVGRWQRRLGKLLEQLFAMPPRLFWVCRFLSLALPAWLRWWLLAIVTAIFCVVVTPVLATDPPIKGLPDRTTAWEVGASDLGSSGEKEWLGGLVKATATKATATKATATKATATKATATKVTAAVDSIEIRPGTGPAEWVRQGRRLYEAGQFAAAVEQLQAALQGYRAAGDRLREAMVLSNLSLAYQQLGDWSEATQTIADSVALLQEAGDKANESDRLMVLAQALNIQGKLRLSRGATEQALIVWEHAADIYDQLGHQRGAIRSRINQAQALQVLGFYRRALQVLTQVEETLQNEPASLTRVAGLRSLGDVRQVIGDLEGARQVLEESLQMARRLRSQSAIAAAQFSLGNVARAQKQTQTALQFYQAAAKSPVTSTQVQAQLNQLSLLLDLERWSAARTVLTKVRTQLSQLPPSRTAVYARINFAQSLLDLEDRRQEAEDRRQRAGGRRQKAEDKNSSSSVLRPPSSLFQEVARILAVAVQQSEMLDDRRAHAYALGHLGELYERTGQRLEAQDLTQQALVLSQTIDAPDIIYRWQWQLGRLLNQQGDREGAIAAYEGAVKTLKSLRSDLVAVNPELQFSFQDSVEPVYRQLVGLLLESDATESDATGAKAEKLEAARKVVESLQVAELDNFFRSACVKAASVRIDQIDRQAAVIYPIILSDRLEVILSLPQQPLRHYTIRQPQTEVEQIATRLLRYLSLRIDPRFFAPSQTLYDWLLRPAEADLAQSGVKTLVFVLDGALRRIPMAVLYDGEQFLIEKYAIAIAPGLELLDSQPLKRRELKVLSAGLSQARQGFSAIPFVKTEIDQIRSQVPSEVLLDQAFTEAAFKQAVDKFPSPVVHLATHGKFSSNAEDTFILTWDDRINVNELNTLLQATELRRSNPIELLVLSACATAKGDKRAALGIAGVAVRAGARSTLASLWLGSDEATAQLMMKFYQELANTEVAKAEALRRAQIAILQEPQYSHPYFWAPFVLVGNWL